MKTQQRFLNLTIPTISNELLLTEFRGEEGLSCPFVYQLNFLSRHPHLADIIPLNQQAHVIIQGKNQPPYYFNGLIAAMEAGPKDYDNQWTYQLSLESWFGLLRNNRDCEGFIDKTVPQIIATVFKKYTCVDYDLKGLVKAYQKRDYCIRYNESAYDFVSRLMEEEGIYYYFLQKKDKHILVLEDGPRPSLIYKTPLHYSNERGGDSPHLYSWHSQLTTRKKNLQSRAFHFTKPKEIYEREYKQGAKSKLPHIIKHYTYDESNHHKNLADLQQQLKQQSQAELASNSHIETAGNYLGLYGGQQISIAHGEADESNVRGQYYITKLQHRAFDKSQRGHHQADDGPEFIYQNRLMAVNVIKPFKPRAKTLKPKIPSGLLGLITGPPGEPIYTNQYAQVKAQLHWDRYSHFDETSSSWIRVRQHYAGNEWGSQFIPRIGQEALVCFEHGNPDKPIIHKNYYNAANPHSFALPGNQSQSGFKTQSLGNRLTEQGHQLRFDDKPNHEEVYLKSQKDSKTYVKGNAEKKINKDVRCTIAKGKKDNTIYGKHCYTGGQRIHLVVGKSEIMLDGSGVNIHADSVSVIQK